MDSPSHPTQVVVVPHPEVDSPRFVVEYCLSSVVTQEAYCNTNNHHDLAPKDWTPLSTNEREFFRFYHRACNPYLFSSWATKLDLKDCLIITLPRSCISTIKEAGRVSILTGKIASHLEDDLKDVGEYIDHKISSAGPPWNSKNFSFFLRLDDCSPKDHGLYPVKNGFEMIDAILKSKRCMTRIENPSEQQEDVKIILKKWRTDIDISNEFRVFIIEGRITAISQYNWFKDGGWGSEKKHLIPAVNKGIHDLFDILKPRLPFTSCVFDVHVLIKKEDEKEFVVVELVEFNPFGAHLSSGSALFHWVKDFDLLNGKNIEAFPVPVIRLVHDEISNQ